MQTLFINNTPDSRKDISTLGNSVTVYLNQPIILDEKKKYQMRLLNANIVYCMPNITASNNILSYSYNGGAYTSVVIPTGLYSLQALQYHFSNAMKSDTNINNDQAIVLYGDYATGFTYVTLIANLKIDCGVNNSIMTILGFNQYVLDNSGNVVMQTVTVTDPVTHITSSYTQKEHNIIGSTTSVIESGNNITQLNALQNILIKCDIASGVYSNSQTSDVIACVTPDVKVGSTIIFRPIHPIRCSVETTRRIDTITITLVDQDWKDIDIGTQGGTKIAELWSVLITIEDIRMAGLL